MGLPAYLLVIAVGIALFFIWLRNRRRTAEIKLIASRYKFHFLETALPHSLSLTGTPIARAYKTWNVIDGERDGIRVVAFDCQIGEGNGSWRQTVIAAQISLEVFEASPFAHELTAERSGKWVVLYQPKAHWLDSVGLMAVSELEAHIDAIRRAR